MSVALFTRAWIEIAVSYSDYSSESVALFTRAWIEMHSTRRNSQSSVVALFTRAWIEIRMEKYINVYIYRRPFHEGVD